MNNNLDLILKQVIAVEKTFKKTITGKEKKEIVKSTLTTLSNKDDDAFDIVNKYSDELIDFVVELCKDKENFKAFKKKCFRVCF